MAVLHGISKNSSQWVGLSLITIKLILCKRASLLFGEVIRALCLDVTCGKGAVRFVSFMSSDRERTHRAFSQDVTVGKGAVNGVRFKSSDICRAFSQDVTMGKGAVSGVSFKSSDIN